MGLLYKLPRIQLGRGSIDWKVPVLVYGSKFILEMFYYTTYPYLSGPDISVGMATGYRLDGPGIESRWEQDFPHLSRPVLGPTQPPVQEVPGLSWG
jgi:hypothetical protein